MTWIAEFKKLCEQQSQMYDHKYLADNSTLSGLRLLDSVKRGVKVNV